ncbi:MAG: OsmC family protein [Gemmatimonadota bacterium]
MTELRVRSVSRHRLVQELQAREHRWLADRPRDSAGGGLGPTAQELLLGSFAAWTAFGVLDLAREKEWAVDAVEVDVSATEAGVDRRESDAAHDPGVAGGLVREIRVRGELDDEERR